MEFANIEKVKETRRLTMELRLRPLKTAEWEIDLSEEDARKYAYAEMADRQMLDGWGGFWSVRDVYRSERDGRVVCVEFEEG